VNYAVWRNRLLGLWLWLASFPVGLVSPGAATVVRVVGSVCIVLLAWSTWTTLRDYRQQTPPVLQGDRPPEPKAPLREVVVPNSVKVPPWPVNLGGRARGVGRPANPTVKRN
jgi:hypothetical protein